MASDSSVLETAVVPPSKVEDIVRQNYEKDQAFAALDNAISVFVARAKTKGTPTLPVDAVNTGTEVSRPADIKQRWSMVMAVYQGGEMSAVLPFVDIDPIHKPDLKVITPTGVVVDVDDKTSNVTDAKLLSQELGINLPVGLNGIVDIQAEGEVTAKVMRLDRSTNAKIVLSVAQAMESIINTPGVVARLQQRNKATQDISDTLMSQLGNRNPRRE